MIDGKVSHGGLSDRIHGILSVYKFCKENNFDFRINFVCPFKLQNYFTPNVYDWTIEENAISYNIKESIPLWFYCTHRKYGISLEDDNQLQYRYLFRNIKKANCKQYHIYTNAHFCEEHSFSSLFHELFKPSFQLQAAIDEQTEKISSDFAAMVFRFQNLLGDFKERNFSALNNIEQGKLIDRCISKIKEIRKIMDASYLILITSDSVKFLTEAKKIDYVRIIPGKVVHMSYTADNKLELHLKSFVDLMVLTNAKKIMLLCTRKMYHSGFAKTAALIGSVDYEEIFF
jgi:hypothetical protein